MTPVSCDLLKKDCFICLVLRFFSFKGTIQARSMSSADEKTLREDPAAEGEDSGAAASAPAKKMRVTSKTAEGAGKKPRDPSRKRGPPRPHRKLSQEILDGRISKLRSRIERCKGQLDDAERHIEGYEKEAKYREQEKKV